MMLCVNNLLSPSNGEPIVAPTLDMVLGCYYLTTAPTRTPRARARRSRTSTTPCWPTTSASSTCRRRSSCASRHRRRSTAKSTRRRPSSQIVTTTIGRVIFNDASTASCATHGQEPLPYYNEMVDRAGLKRIVAGAASDATATSDTAQVVDAIKRLGLPLRHPVGHDDRHRATSRCRARRTSILQGRRRRGRSASSSEYRRGLITDEERYNEVIEVWTKAKDQVTKAVGERARPVRPGDDDGQVGRQGQHPADPPDGRHARPDGRPVGPHHRPADPLELPRGLTVLEYFISTHGARKGLADTALRTADSGYLTRRLIDVAQDVIVYEDDCGTEPGIWINDLAEPARREPAAGPARRPRRWPRDVVDEATGEVIVERNEDHRRGRARRRSPRRARCRSVYVRSPLTCEARHGICQLCYGWHLGTRRTGRDRRGGRHHRRAVHRRAGHAADDAHVPHRRCRAASTSPRSAARRGAVRGARAEGQGDHRRDRRRGRAAAHRRRAASSRSSRARRYRDEHDLPTGYELLVEHGAWVEIGQPVAAHATDEERPRRSSPA